MDQGCDIGSAGGCGLRIWAPHIIFENLFCFGWLCRPLNEVPKTGDAKYEQIQRESLEKEASIAELLSADILSMSNKDRDAWIIQIGDLIQETTSSKNQLETRLETLKEVLGTNLEALRELSLKLNELDVAREQTRVTADSIPK
jgi:hypothetical protein